ncbi:MAG: glycoside hydrolase family 5 protein [Treponema sp.]|nr:glycoside hydrolase family 5 protein [Treponema sp.]
MKAEELEDVMKDSGNKTFSISSDTSALDFVENMGFGWNLGNTFDAHAYNWLENYWERGIECEFDWEKVETTKELLEFPIANGYKTIRIPVTWYCHIIDDKYTIDPFWMKRVKRVVDMALEAGYYVILNEHHSVHGDTETTYKTIEGKEDEYETRRMNLPLEYGDGYIVSSNAQDIKESKAFLKAIWTQIAEAFNNGYDEKLIFETMNEPRNSRDYHADGKSHEWNPGLKLPYHKADNESIGGYWCDNLDCKICHAEYEVLNEYNQLCLDVIRASGGNNAQRFVMIPGLCTGIETVLPKIADEENGIFSPGLFKMPQDSVEDRLILTIHQYPAWKIDEYPQGVFSKRMENNITALQNLLDQYYVSKGIPVIIGETGTGRSPISYDERVKWISHLIKEARSHKMCVIWWDCGSSEESSATIDRVNKCFYEPELIQTIMDAMYN